MSTERPVSGVVTFASGDAGSTKDLIDIREEETFRFNDIEITYSGSGTTQAVVTFYDEDAGTSATNATNRVDEYQVGPGDEIVATGLMRNDIEDDVVVLVGGNDAEVSISSGGEIVTG